MAYTSNNLWNAVSAESFGFGSGLGTDFGFGAPTSYFGADFQSEIIVTAPSEYERDWWSISVTPDQLATVGIFFFGDAFVTPQDTVPDGAFPFPTPDGRIPINRRQASEGQEDFADDGDVFNDGEAPTFKTVQAWLLSESDKDFEFMFIIREEVGGPEGNFTGSYSTGDGRVFTFFSDGHGNYGQDEILPDQFQQSTPDDFMF